MSSTSTNAPSYLADRLADPAFRKEFDREALSTEFASQVLLVMEQEGISKARLAEMLDCSRAYVTKLLRGDSNPTLHTLADLAGALNRRVRLQFDEAAIEDAFSKVNVVASHTRVNVTKLRFSLDADVVLPWTCRDAEEVAA